MGFGRVHNVTVRLAGGLTDANLLGQVLLVEPALVAQPRKPGAERPSVNVGWWHEGRGYAGLATAGKIRNELLNIS